MINRKQTITYGVLVLVAVFAIGSFAVAQGPSLMDRIALNNVVKTIFAAKIK